MDIETKAFSNGFIVGDAYGFSVNFIHSLEDLYLKAKHSPGFLRFVKTKNTERLVHFVFEGQIVPFELVFDNTGRISSTGTSQTWCIMLLHYECISGDYWK